MNVSSQKFVIPTRGPMHIAPGFAVFVLWPTVGLLMWCGLMWLGFTLWPVIRGCLG